MLPRIVNRNKCRAKFSVDKDLEPGPPESDHSSQSRSWSRSRWDILPGAGVGMGDGAGVLLWSLSPSVQNFTAMVVSIDSNR